MKTKMKLELNKMNIPQLLGFSDHVVSEMTGNSYFPNPTPALRKISDAITSLQDAYNHAQGGGPQQTANARQCRLSLETLLIALGHYVEDTANNPDNATADTHSVILSAGMKVKRVTPRQRQSFKVLLGGLPGTVIVIAESVKRGAHEWQYSSDVSNPGLWVNRLPTIQSKTIIDGLESGRRYYFRHRIVLPAGVTTWNEPKSIMVS